MEKDIQKFRCDLSTNLNHNEHRSEKQCQAMQRNIEAKIAQVNEMLQHNKAEIQNIPKKEFQSEILNSVYMPEQDLSNNENNIPLTRVLQNINMNQKPKNAIKKKILCLYSDEKLYTANTLKKLEDDLLQDYKVESISTLNLDNYQAKAFDKIFLFYFLTGEREQADIINNMASRIYKMWPGKQNYLILLKDVKCKAVSVDLQRVSFTTQTIKMYTIFDEGFARLILYIDKPPRSMNPDYVRQVKENYEKLIIDIRDTISIY